MRCKSKYVESVGRNPGFELWPHGLLALQLYKSFKIIIGTQVSLCEMEKHVINSKVL